MSGNEKDKCDDCGWVWSYPTDYCPNCGGENYADFHDRTCDCPECVDGHHDGEYVQISVKNGGSYIQPKSKIMNAIHDELDCLKSDGPITITFEHVDITDEEYKNLPEFTGH